MEEEAGEWSEDAIWKQAQEARQQEKRNAEDSDDDSDVDVDNFFAKSVERDGPRCRGRSLLVQLQNGGFHVCYGANCKFVVQDNDKNLVCSITGICVATETIRDADPTWTGRTTTSANPDDVGPAPGGWKKRRDMFSASVSAWQSAKNIDASHVQYRESEKEAKAREERALVKRGARCVDEVASPTVRKRVRTSKKDMEASHAVEKLMAEAMLTIEKLLQKERVYSSSFASSSKTTREVPSEEGVAKELVAAQEDARLMNPKFVLNLVIRKYVSCCNSKGIAPDLNSIHDAAMHANAYVRIRRDAKEKEEREKATRVTGSGVCFSGRVQGLCCSLVVALWRACCLTPYFKDDKKSTDSFRPFVSGVLYALKRGFSIRGGLEVVPSLPELASLLPTLRTQGLTPIARQLQASSHRGLCSLHRSVSSILEMGEEDLEEIGRAFEIAAQAARALESHVHDMQNQS